MRWTTSPPSDGLVLMYEVRYRPQHTSHFVGNETIETKNVSCLESIAVLTQLQIFTLYSVSLRGSSVNGVGPFNNISTVRTSEGSK